MPEEELPPNSPAPALPTKEELEKQKLTEELRRLQSPAWQTSAFLGGIVPVATSTIALMIAIASVLIPLRLGVFNVEQKNLEAKKTLLEYDTRKLTEERAGLLQSNRVAESRRVALADENQRLQRELGAKDRLFAAVQRQLSNEVVKADTTTNKVALLLLNELRRVEAQRDALAATNRSLRAQLSAARAITVNRVTEETEDGTLRDSEGQPIRDADGAIILTDDKGVPFTQGDGTVFTQGPSRPATNAMPKTNAAPRPQ